MAQPPETGAPDAPDIIPIRVLPYNLVLATLPRAPTRGAPTICYARTRIGITNELAGIAPGSTLAVLRALRPDAARFAQGSYDALLEPDDPAGVSRVERELIALRVAVLDDNASLAAHHRQHLRQLGVVDRTIAAAEQFPNGAQLSQRESAILQHVDRLTREPGAATPADIEALRAGGLSTRDIVTIAQLIAFESFQVRLLAGLRLLAEEQ